MSKIHVPGIVYHACLDPMATAWPKENNFPEPVRWHRSGRGIWVEYELDANQEIQLSEWLYLWASAVDDGHADPGTQREIRACRTLARELVTPPDGDA